MRFHRCEKVVLRTMAVGLRSDRAAAKGGHGVVDANQHPTGLREPIRDDVHLMIA